MQTQDKADIPAQDLLFLCVITNIPLLVGCHMATGTSPPPPSPVLTGSPPTPLLVKYPYPPPSTSLSIL